MSILQNHTENFIKNLKNLDFKDIEIKEVKDKLNEID